MKIAHLAIQCVAHTGELGSFLFEPDSMPGKMVAVSPVMPCVPDLLYWCRENGWKSAGYDEVLRDRGACGTYVKRDATIGASQ